jgi:hypothetical protein
LPSWHTSHPSKTVIAGLDPAIQEKRMFRAPHGLPGQAQVKPGNDTPGAGAESECAIRFASQPWPAAEKALPSAAFDADVRALNRTAVGSTRVL